MKDLIAKKNNLTYSDLERGQTYVLSENASFDKNVYIFKFKDFKTNYHSVYCYYLTYKTEFGIINPYNGIFSEGSLAISGRYMKKASHEVEHWLQECITKQCFIPFGTLNNSKKFRLWKLK
jgi:hypothetical protein